MKEAKPRAALSEADPGQGPAWFPNLLVACGSANFLGVFVDLAADAFMAVRGNSIVKHLIPSGEGIPFMCLLDMPAFNACVVHCSSLFAELLRCKKELFTRMPR
jgi:hypothetical protein